MSATARAAINRLNAEASTGPKTEAGKARSSRNALAHGLTSQQIVLPHESQEEYDHMRQGLIESHAPANDGELLLVDRIAQAWWRLERSYSVERAFLENRIADAQEQSPEIDPGTAMAQLFIDKAESNRMRLLMRYLAAAERAYYKALADLTKAQADRRKREAEEARDEVLRTMYAGAGEPDNCSFNNLPADGFVSQSVEPLFEIPAVTTSLPAGIELPCH
jgi:hypothetical protein